MPKTVLRTSAPVSASSSFYPAGKCEEEEKEPHPALPYRLFTKEEENKGGRNGRKEVTRFSFCGLGDSTNILRRVAGVPEATRQHHFNTTSTPIHLPTFPLPHNTTSHSVTFSPCHHHHNTTATPLHFKLFSTSSYPINTINTTTATPSPSLNHFHFPPAQPQHSTASPPPQ